MRYLLIALHNYFLFQNLLGKDNKYYVNRFGEIVAYDRACLMKSSISDTAVAACVSSNLWPASKTWASILGSVCIQDRTSARSKNGSCLPQIINARGCQRAR